MKNWKIWIIAILSSMIIFLVGMLVGKAVSDKLNEENIEKSENAKPLILRVYEDESIDKIQVLTICAGDEVIYQYCGDMEKEVSEDGTEIIFTVPPINDSCFEE